MMISCIGNCQMLIFHITNDRRVSLETDKTAIMSNCMCTYHMRPRSTSRMTAMSIAMWKVCNYEQLCWQLSYVFISHITNDHRVIHNVEKGQL